MKSYERPVLVVNEELSEGIYMASGDAPGCDSKYMNGVWQGMDTSDWAGGTRGYKQQFGCLGCRSYTPTGCGLQGHFIEANQSSSYDDDNGIRMPAWERKGYEPDAIVSDWDCD